MGGRKINLSEYPDANQSRDEHPLGEKKINLSEYPDENMASEKKEVVKNREPIKKQDKSPEKIIISEFLEEP